MPALVEIDSPNERIDAPAVKQDLIETKKRIKASSLCYTPPAMINDKKRERSYFRHGLLGEGGFARCFEVTDFSGHRLAAKCIAKKSITSEKVKMKLLGEIKVHKSMTHPNIVKQRDCFEDEINVYMILDICLNGTLMDMLRTRKRFTEPEVRYYGLQILGAAKYMHSRRVIHRDLKLGNLFLDEHMNLKVGDFGLAALLVDDNDRKKTMCGTPNYIAPEVLFSAPEGHSYEVDLWSIGVIFYAMLVGRPPFQSKDVKAIYAKIKTNEYEFPEDSKISSAAKSLIASLLSTEPDSRPCIDDIAGHQFFNSGIMPRTIPTSATRQEPIWPESQARSVFTRNLDYVSVNAGIGQNKCAGAEPGQKVDVVVEVPERGHYLPTSLSPRIGPKAKMINLKTERAGGRTDTLSDRLQSARISDVPTLDSTTKVPGQAIELAQNRDLRRAALRAGAMRAQRPDALEIQAPEPRPQEKPLPRLRGAQRLDLEAQVPGPARARHRPALTGHTVSEPARAIPRSSRYTQLPLAEGALHKRSNSGTSASSTASSRESKNACDVEKEYPRTSSRVSRRQSPIDGKDEGNLAPEQPISAPEAPDGQSMWQDISRLADHLLLYCTGQDSRRELRASQLSKDAILYISKWVDYSHKYGLGYQLSDESTGVYFNDATSIMLKKHANNFDYIPSHSRKETHGLDGPPKELEKKVYLLKHFKGYMTTHLNDAATKSESTISNSQSVCYMTHYLRTTEGILFRLSDGTMQVNFVDHSKLMLPMPDELHQCCIRYVDAGKSINVWSLTQATRQSECREKIETMAKLMQDFVASKGRAQAT